MKTSNAHYLLENLNTAVAKAAELTDDPRLLRHLGAIKNAARQLVELGEENQSAAEQGPRRVATGSARPLNRPT